MSDKDKVLKAYPNAIAEPYSAKLWAVWDGTTKGRDLLGIGTTEDIAWKDAVFGMEVDEDA